FFSSRRRHTRFSRDWSSDVCSSDLIARAHHAAVELSALAVVVAHLDGALETLPGAGIGRPVEDSLKLRYVVARLVAEQRAVVHAWRSHDFAGIHEPRRVECVLHLLEQLDGLSTVHHLVELGPGEAVAVLARMRALVFLCQRER